MSKILVVMTFILLSQTAYANDFLLPGKQLLICDGGEVLFRINWEDWDVEDKSFAIRTKNKLRQFNLGTDRDGPEILYTISADYTSYENGQAHSSDGYYRVIGPELDQGYDSTFRFHYVDKSAADAQLKKVCKK